MGKDDLTYALEEIKDKTSELEGLLDGVTVLDEHEGEWREIIEANDAEDVEKALDFHADYADILDEYEYDAYDLRKVLEFHEKWLPIIGESLATDVKAALRAQQGVDVKEMSALLVLLNEVTTGMTAGDLNLLVSEGSPAREQFVLFLRATGDRSVGSASFRLEQRFLSAFLKGGE